MNEGAESARATPANAVRRMLELFDLRQIEYCHWKSNEHAVAAIMGDTDLDLLFNAGQRALVEEVLTSIGFRVLKAAEHARYPGIVDYVMLDADALRMIHVHAHYQLRLGEKFVKSYHVPWERLILTTRIREPIAGIYATRPDVEAVLLIVRFVLKLRFRDRVGAILGKWKPDSDFVRELAWLLRRSSPEEISAVARELIGEATSALILSFLSTGSLDGGSVWRLRKAVKRDLALHRTLNSFQAGCVAARREILLYWLAFRRRILGQTVPMRRTNPRGGLIVVLLGTDGSGKSTAVRELTRILARKIDVMNVYFGTGEGAGLLLRAINAIRGGSAKRSNAGMKGTRTGRRGIASQIALAAWSVLAARAKRRALRKAVRAKASGQIVLCDRYPQRQFPRIGDGPVLGDIGASSPFLLRWASRFEKKVYDQIAAVPPDIVFKLKVSAATAYARKPGQPSIAVLEQKLEIVDALNFPRAVSVQIDAEQPLNRVLSSISAPLWSRYP
jgi:energy-coupling factor transporter ATP-binding protein EcfA2